MADIAKSGTPSVATTIVDPGPHQIHGRAAVKLAAGDCLYKKADGTLDKTDGTAADAKALYVGIAPGPAEAGEAAVAYHDTEVRYGANLTPGARVYVSATPGAVADAPTTGGTAPIGFVVNSTNIYFFPPNR
jgi:hypothetical protein